MITPTEAAAFGFGFGAQADVSLPAVVLGGGGCLGVTSSQAVANSSEFLESGIFVRTETDAMKHVTWLWSATYLLALSLSGLAAACDPNNTPVSGSANEPGAALAQGVTGVASRPDGKPVAGAFVQTRSLDVPGKAIPELAVLTDETGRYTWPLGSGSYELTISADGYRSSTKKVTVKDGQLVTLDFVLEPAS